MAIKVVCMGLPVHGPTHVSVDWDPACDLTLKELVVRYLAPQFDGNLRQILFDQDNLRDDYVVLVNGRNALGLDGADTALEDNAEVLITPPVGGG